MDYLTQLHAVSAPYLALPNVQLQLAEITRCRHELDQGQLLSRPLPPLGLTESDWWDFVRLDEARQVALTTSHRRYQQLQNLLVNFRKYLQYHTGQWTLLSQQALRVWTKYWPFRRYLELMAGDGRLARALTSRGQAVIATDNLAWRQENVTGRQLFYPVQAADAQTAVARYGQQVDVILLSWSPNRDPLDWVLRQQIAALPNRPDLLVIGEPFGVTNSELFWRTQQPNFSAPLNILRRYLPPTSDGVHEGIYLYRSTSLKGGRS